MEEDIIPPGTKGCVGRAWGAFEGDEQVHYFDYGESFINHTL